MTFERSSPRHPEEEAEERMSSRGWIRVCVDIYIYIHEENRAQLFNVALHPQGDAGME